MVPPMVDVTPVRIQEVSPVNLMTKIVFPQLTTWQAPHLIVQATVTRMTPICTCTTVAGMTTVAATMQLSGQPRRAFGMSTQMKLDGGQNRRHV